MQLPHHGIIVGRRSLPRRLSHDCLTHIGFLTDSASLYPLPECLRLFFIQTEQKRDVPLSHPSTSVSPPCRRLICNRHIITTPTMPPTKVPLKNASILLHSPFRHGALSPCNLSYLPEPPGSAKKGY